MALSSFLWPIWLTTPAWEIFLAWGNGARKQEHQREAAQHTERFAPLYDRLAALSAEELVVDAEAMQVGRRLFINNCATCHGVNAGGTPGFPNLRDSHWIWGSTFQEIHTTIKQGRTAIMPPWGSALGNVGVTQVAHHVRSLAELPHDADQAAAGADSFQVFCVSCHGAEGKGNPLLGSPDLTNGVFMYGSDLTSIASTVSLGRNGEMPAFEQILGAERTKLLAAYIQSLQQ